MRLITYLNEEESFNPIFNVLKKSVNKDFKDFVKITKALFYRGVPGMHDDWQIKTPRRDREPMNMTAYQTNILDKYFKKKFGWRVRSEGVFTSTTLGGAKGYGTMCTFWPIGDFKYVFCPGIHDLFIQIPVASINDVMNFLKGGPGLKPLPKDLVDILNNYEIYLKKHPWSLENQDNEMARKANDATLKFIVDQYQGNKLLDAFNSVTEVVFKCNSYLAVRSSGEMDKAILEELSR